MSKIMKVLVTIVQIVVFVVLSQLLVYYKNKIAYGALFFTSLVLVILCIRFVKDDKSILFLVLVCIYLIIVSLAVIFGIGFEDLDVSPDNKFIWLFYMITLCLVAQSPRIIFAVYGFAGILFIWVLKENHLGRISAKCVHSVKINRDRVYLYPVYDKRIFKIIYMQGHSRKTITTLPFHDKATGSKACYDLKWDNEDYCEVMNLANNKSRPIRIYLKKAVKRKLEAKDENV